MQATGKKVNINGTPKFPGSDYDIVSFRFIFCYRARSTQADSTALLQMYETFGDASTPYFEGSTFEESTAFLKVNDILPNLCLDDFANSHPPLQTLGFEFTPYEQFAREKVAPAFSA